MYHAGKLNDLAKSGVKSRLYILQELDERVEFRLIGSRQKPERHAQTDGERENEGPTRNTRKETLDTMGIKAKHRRKIITEGISSYIRRNSDIQYVQIIYLSHVCSPKDGGG